MQSVTRIAPPKPDDERVWRKVNSHTHDAPRARLPVPRVVRHRSDDKTAHVVLASSMLNALRVNVFHDGGTRIAIEPNDRGDYKVASQGRSRRMVTIPRRLVHLIGVGLWSVTVEVRNGMIEIDLAAAKSIKPEGTA